MKIGTEAVQNEKIVFNIPCPAVRDENRVYVHIGETPVLYFVRSGPETMVLVFKDGFKRAEEILLKWGVYYGNDPETAVTAAGEYCRIIIALIADKGRPHPETRVYLSDIPHQRLFCMLLNGKAGGTVEHSWVEPGYVMMRLLGDLKKGFARIKEDFGGEIVPKSPYFRRSLPEDSTVLYFTKYPLNHRIPHEAMHDDALLIKDYSKEALIFTLRMRQDEYLGDSLGTPDWNCMEIQIGDIEGRFNIHRRRIWTAVQGNQTGTILEEGWRREYTLMGKVVGVYVLKLFTPLDEEAIKEFLLGLEYDESGGRVADLDLFFRGKKISWKERGGNGGLSKAELGLAAREKMLKGLDRYSLIKMRQLDAELKTAS